MGRHHDHQPKGEGQLHACPTALRSYPPPSRAAASHSFSGTQEDNLPHLPCHGTRCITECAVHTCADHVLLPPTAARPHITLMLLSIAPWYSCGRYCCCICCCGQQLPLQHHHQVVHAVSDRRQHGFSQMQLPPAAGMCRSPSQFVAFFHVAHDCCSAA